MGYHPSLSSSVAAVAAVVAVAPDAVTAAAGVQSAFDPEERTNSSLVEQADIKQFIAG